jgi:dTDP-4-amino-4,6-dideoxygalactose transaminase
MDSSAKEEKSPHTIPVSCRNTFFLCPIKHIHKASVYYRYVVIVDKLDEIQRETKEKGVMCEKPVWKPLHEDISGTKCPNSDYVHAHALSIPLYPGLREEEIEHVTRTLKTVLKDHLHS